MRWSALSSDSLFEDTSIPRRDDHSSENARRHCFAVSRLRALKRGYNLFLRSKEKKKRRPPSLNRNGTAEISQFVVKRIQLSSSEEEGVMSKVISVLLWPVVAIVGAFSFAALALGRGENVSAIWLVTAAVCVYFIAYRFYSKFIADKVLRLDDTRQTPAERHNDGMDYVPTNRWVLYGHHFAAIAGAGPLVGPVLAAQMGFLPGTLWILAGVVLAGAVQDFIVLFASVRRDGKSLGEMIKMELGPVPGSLALVGVLAIMIIILAVLSLVVVKALADSPWGLFTIAATIPIALIMGIYMRIIRPGRVGEASVIGVVLLMTALIYGQTIANDPDGVRGSR